VFHRVVRVASNVAEQRGWMMTLRGASPAREARRCPGWVAQANSPCLATRLSNISRRSVYAQMPSATTAFCVVSKP